MTTPANTITVSVNGFQANYPFTIRNILEAASYYKQRARTPGDTFIVNGRQIQLEDIFKLNMPGRLGLARKIFEDLDGVTIAQVPERFSYAAIPKDSDDVEAVGSSMECPPFHRTSRLD